MDFTKFASKGTALVIEIVIVFVVVGAFAWFDPFGLFTTSKKTLKDTPIQVRSIKEIGQLITAEYYGEVIASLEEALDQETKMEIDSFNYDIELLHRDFVSAIDSIALSDLKRNKIYDVFLNEYQDIKDDALFRQYAYYINEKLKDRRYSKRELNKSLNDEQLNELVTKLGLERHQNLRDDLHAITTDEIQYRFKDDKIREQAKNNKNRRLVLLGRGWVKAGFDFGSFTEKNFIYEKSTKRIFLIGLKPKILSATINPWFIPEKGVEGFEFVVVERRVKQKPELTKRVKQRCLDKLINQAMEKQILEKAQANAEKHLRHLFSLMHEGKDPVKVYFRTSYLDYSLEALLEDSLIRDDEVLTLSDILINYQKKQENTDISNLLQQNLVSARKEIYGQDYTLNSKSVLLFKIVQDRKIDKSDQPFFEAMHKATAIDSLWLTCFLKKKEVKITNGYLDSTRAQAIADLRHIKEVLNLPVDSTMLRYGWMK